MQLSSLTSLLEFSSSSNSLSGLSFSVSFSLVASESGIDGLQLSLLSSLLEYPSSLRSDLPSSYIYVQYTTNGYTIYFKVMYI